PSTPGLDLSRHGAHRRHRSAGGRENRRHTSGHPGRARGEMRSRHWRDIRDALARTARSVRRRTDRSLVRSVAAGRCGVTPARRAWRWSALPVVLLAATALARQTSAPEAAVVEHVLMIGIDGLSPEGIRKTETPVLNGLMKDGAYTLHARAV